MLARNPVSLVSLIAWLKTKDPVKTYNFCDTQGACLYSQYLHEAFGFDPDPVNEYTNAPWTALHHEYNDVAAYTPWAFGAALKRAEAKIFAT